MANRYIRHGETYCGNGTTSAAATANSAADNGAWNDINVMEGTAPAYGTLSAGDVVYIRSKTPAGANITRTVGANINIGSANATVANPISWVLDNGATWSGINGILTYDIAAGNYGITVRDNNIFESLEEDALEFKVTYANYYAGVLALKMNVVMKNIRVNCQAVTFTSNGATLLNFYQGSQSCEVQVINPRLDVGSNWPTAGAISISNYGVSVMTNPRINLVSPPGNGYALFLGGDYGASLNVIGGSITGNTSGVKLMQLVGTGGLSPLRFTGTQIPANMTILHATPATFLQDSRVECTGCDGGIGSFSYRNCGSVDSRQDGNYPTLNGTYPNSTSTGWSWKLYPYYTAKTQPLDVTSLKLYTDAAATKTLTVELLVATAFLSLAHKGSVWLEVSYIDDSTGGTKYVSSCNLTSTTALDSSSAGWSATTYGATALTKKNIALTTPTSIKQDTVITATLRVAARSVSATDLIFVDPDPQLT
jgi:hypothetical protein